MLGGKLRLEVEEVAARGRGGGWGGGGGQAREVLSNALDFPCFVLIKQTLPGSVDSVAPAKLRFDR